MHWRCWASPPPTGWTPRKRTTEFPFSGADLPALVDGMPMRDLTRLREKREFSLDDRQVVALAVCAVLLLAGVFALGVTLGKRLSAPPPPPAELAQLDQAAKPPPAVVPNQPTPPQEQLPPPTPAEEKPAPKAEVGSIGDTNRGSAAHHVPDRARAIPAPQRAAMVVAPPPRPLQVASPAPVALTP